MNGQCGNKQNRMPFVEALENYRLEHFVPFHTPGHKIGQAAPELLKVWMNPALSYDLGVMYALDDLHEPEGALLEAEQLASELYGSNYTWFSINGTTSIIEAMIMGVVQDGEEIIIPREAHRSVISGLILSGAKPVYLPGRYSAKWGVTLGTTPQEVEKTILANPKVKALLLVNPNYYGIALNMAEIVRIAHAYGLVVLVDEAHGAHLKFHANLPVSALECGADLVAQSTHKLIGSLTQTSMLHMQGSLVNQRRITQAYQMLQSTSPNYIFLASLDMARHQMAQEGEKLLARTIQLAEKLRTKLATIPGIQVMSLADVRNEQEAEDYINLDITKVLIDFSELGLTGQEAEKMLRQEKIEVELVAENHVLVLITIGDTEESIESLVKAVQTLSSQITNQNKGVCKVALDKSNIYQNIQESAMSKISANQLPVPKVVLTPRVAYNKNTTICCLREAVGKICGETITYYPPGIPFISMGEEITQGVIDFISHKQKDGFLPNGAEDKTLATIKVIVE